MMYVVVSTLQLILHISSYIVSYTAPCNVRPGSLSSISHNYDAAIILSVIRLFLILHDGICFSFEISKIAILIEIFVAIYVCYMHLLKRYLFHVILFQGRQ